MTGQGQDQDGARDGEQAAHSEAAQPPAAARPLRPRILYDDDAGRLNRSGKAGDEIARSLPEWDLLPPHGLVERAR